jgi:hypothetical protein
MVVVCRVSRLRKQGLICCSQYCVALFIELISFLFMMGRIMHLIVKSKAHARARMSGGPSAQRRSLALPLIRGYQWQLVSFLQPANVR